MFQVPSPFREGQEIDPFPFQGKVRMGNKSLPLAGEGQDGVTNNSNPNGYSLKYQ